MSRLPSYFSTLATFLVCGLIFLAPINLFVKFAESQGYVRGLLVDYLLPKFYVSDLPILALIGLTLITDKPSQFKLGRFLKVHWLWSLLVALTVIALGIHQLSSPYPFASIWYFAKLLEMAALAISVCLWKKELYVTWLWKTLAVTIFFQSSLGLYQFVTQHALFNYHILGETNLDFVSGVAKASFGGALKILPYGTTAHPNVLAGCLVLFTLLLWQTKNKISPTWIWLRIIATGLALVTLYLTQSVTAWLALVIGITFLGPLKAYFKQRLKLGLLLVSLGIILVPITLPLVSPLAPNNSSLTRRVILNHAAWATFSDSPLVGTGLNTNAAMNENMTANQESVRFVQPAHNILLVWISETGLIGILLLVLWIKRGWRQLSIAALSVLLPIAALDHYLVTLQTGLLISILFICLKDSTVTD